MQNYWTIILQQLKRLTEVPGKQTHKNVKKNMKIIIITQLATDLYMDKNHRFHLGWILKRDKISKFIFQAFWKDFKGAASREAWPAGQGR